jgi:hypothetical protein
MNNEEDSSFSVNDLISHIKDSTATTKKIAADPEVSRENLEQFVLSSTGRLVTQGLEIVEGVKDYVMNNPESREVVALSEALKAVASALSIVKDIHVTQMKADTAKNLKKMDIDSKRELKEEDNKVRFLMSRDEMFKKIMEEAKTIEAEAVLVSSHQALSG